MPTRDSAYQKPSEQAAASSEKRKHSEYNAPKKFEHATTSSVVANGTEWVREMTDKKPFLTVAAAVGVGIVLGAFWAR